MQLPPMERLRTAPVRARIGFTAVAYVTETFPKVFYEMVPDGVVLTLMTEHLTRSTSEEMKRIHEQTLSHARAFARARCSVVFLGGAPTNLAHGWDHLRRMLAELEQELGVPVTSNATAQHNAFRALGARKVGVVNPYASHRKGQHDKHLVEAGLNPVAEAFAGEKVEDYHLIPAQRAFDLGAALKRDHPEIDTLFYACPHWNVADAVEALEEELKINVVASINAIVWEGLRTGKVADRIDGYGKLLREC
jgi:maleate cis-trans isomerase